MRSAAASSTVPREGHICPLYWAILKLQACVSWYAKDILLGAHPVAFFFWWQAPYPVEILASTNATAVSQPQTRHVTGMGRAGGHEAI